MGSVIKDTNTMGKSAPTLKQAAHKIQDLLDSAAPQEVKIDFKVENLYAMDHYTSKKQTGSEHEPLVRMVVSNKNTKAQGPKATSDMVIGNELRAIAKKNDLEIVPYSNGSFSPKDMLLARSEAFELALSYLRARGQSTEIMTPVERMVKEALVEANKPVIVAAPMQKPVPKPVTVAAPLN